MSAQRHDAEQLTMPMPVAVTRPTLGQMRDERDALIERLAVLAGHRNQVVKVSRERLEQIALVAVCESPYAADDFFIPFGPVMSWVRNLPSRRWRERLQRLRIIGVRIFTAESERVPNAKRIPVLPPPKTARQCRAA